MQPLPVDRQTLALLKRVGVGRHISFPGATLTLLFRRGGGHGLIASAQAGNESVRLWIDTRQWCRWIEPVLSVPHWEAVPSDLLGVLAVWSFSGIHAGLDSIGIAPLSAHSIETATCEISHAWSLRIERADASLDAHVIDAPLSWLEQLIDRLEPLAVEPLHGASPSPTIPIALIVGWSCVDIAMLNRVRSGDALVLHRAYAITKGELGLFADRPTAHLTQCGNGSYRIGETMTSFDDWLDVEPVYSLEPAKTTLDARVRIVAQVATIDIPLAQLAGLKPGEILEGPAHTDGLVTLQVAGKPFARGTLLDIDGRVAVRIEHFVAPSIQVSAG
ncbi:type III secretion system cytoplasmic ring protein SctQ [Burkholderia ubonensis]|uniref:type III secretion system cytoplasmic ring protein SctQ n=1 Tax=Burkholderia ubonensis TaxID=101571 RepID=UPI00075CFAAA|nr:type III secretion system cytoplasmic ring protein SctQ [Burkholderia ubonensis]KWN58210.1 hypothetical protein WM23_17690 [Burkholderia ubonensis]